MITRELIRELAEFQTPNGDAITLYFQPDAPQDKSHRHEAIQLKDLVKEAMRKAERAGKNGSVKADLERILELSDRLHGISGKARVVFACASKGYWREAEMPARFASNRLQMNSKFHVTPLAKLNDALEKVCVCLVEPGRARFFELHLDEIKEQASLMDEIPRRGRSDGFAGFDAGHSERRVENEETKHYKRVGERLIAQYGNGSCDRILIGCRHENWAALEKQLHPYVKQRLTAHFELDAASATLEQVRQESERLLREHRAEEQQGLLREVVDEARANNNGALGLKHVLRALEMGEVQIILLGEGFSAEGVECKNCGHLDIRMVKHCAVCGQETHELEDIADALMARAMRAGVTVMQLPSDPALQKAGNIAARLRFRADRSMGEKLA